METWILAGASGLVGTALADRLRREGTRVVHLRRPGSRPAPDTVGWNPGIDPLDPASLQGAAAVVNLAGASIASPWTTEHRRRILSSRLAATGTLARALQQLGNAAPPLVSASATGWYGDRGEEELDETSGPGTGFLATVAQAWEEEALRSGTRTTLLRLGVVLSRRGGALPRLLAPIRLGLGGPLGNGRQWFPWIHLDDAVAAAIHAVRNGLSGPVLAVSPSASRELDLCRAAARAANRPAFLPVPAAVLRMLPGGMGRELFLSSQRCRPGVLLNSGFRWGCPELAEAVR